MKRILHAEWKRASGLNPSYRKALTLFYKRILDSTENHNCFFSHEDIDHLLTTVSQNKEYNWCVIHGEGVLYGDQTLIGDLFKKHIDSLPDNCFVTGQLIDKTGQYCGIHEQVFAVNLDLYRKWGCPKFGDYEKKELKLADYKASDSIHDNYTPKKVEPTGEKSLHQTWTCGWNFVNESLHHGSTIYNLPDSIRNEKVYLYPDDNIEKLNHNLQLLFQLESSSEINQNRALLFYIQKKLGLDAAKIRGTRFGYLQRRSHIFLYNTEHLLPEEYWIERFGEPLSTYIGTAAGILDVAKTSAFGVRDSQFKIVYYDMNTDALNYKKSFWENFSGSRVEDIIDYNKEYQRLNPGVLLDFRKEDLNIASLKAILENFNCSFKEHIEKMRAATKVYLSLNLIDDFKKVISHAEGYSFMSVSDVFLGQNELYYGWDLLQQRYGEFFKQAGKHKNLIIQGKDLSDRFFIGQASQDSFEVDRSNGESAQPMSASDML